MKILSHDQIADMVLFWLDESYLLENFLLEIIRQFPWLPSRTQTDLSIARVPSYLFLSVSSLPLFLRYGRTQALLL